MDSLKNYSVYAIYTVEFSIYIGITSNWPKRRREHLRHPQNKNLKHLSQFYKMYAEELYKDLTELEASKIEADLIKNFRADPSYRVMNILDGGLHRGSTLLGEKHHKAKVSDENVIEIRYKWAEDNKVKLIELAEQYGVAPATISNIVRGKRSPHLGGPIILQASERKVRI